MTSLRLLPLLALLLFVGVAESFVVVDRQRNCNVVALSLQQQQGHEDHLIPNEIRVERSKNIRDKLLGDDDGQGKTAVATKKDTKKKKTTKTKDDGHAMLSRLTELFDQHLMDMEDFDPNC